MLYAPIKQEDWPIQWEELEYLTKQLRRMDYYYDVIAERFMFGAYERHQFVLIKWHQVEPKREELGTYKTIEEIIPIVKLLIATEEDRLKALRIDMDELP